MIDGAGCLLLSVPLTGFCTDYTQFVLTQGVLGGTGCGLLFTPAISVLAHYFSKNRAHAISIAVAGSSLGGIVIPAIVDHLLNYQNISFQGTLNILWLVLSTFSVFACTVVKERLPA